VRFDILDLLLLISAIVAIVTRRLHLPYATGLVAAGMCLAAVPFASKVDITKDLIFTVLLPPLVFEAAFRIPWTELRRDLAIIVVLATAGVILSAAVTALGMHYLAGWEWLSCAIFGVLIAATDPVSVIAIFREAGAHGRLLLLVEAESLFNDGTAAVAFAVVTAFAAGQGIAPLAVAPMAVVMIGGGIMCGVVVAACALLLTGRTDDHLVEITVTTVAAYGSSLLAERFHLSGVLATLTAGIIMGNSKPGVISVRGREAVVAFWEYAAFVANSLVFLMIGMRTAPRDLLVFWFAAVVAILLVTLGRALAIYPCCLLFSRGKRPVSRRHQHILFWGGLRGALALALALGLPPDIAGRQHVITVSFAVVAFSIFVQGLTTKPLLHRLGEVPTSK
jgi:CPA1 family monovalent cation:H+ antiporter